MNDQLAALALVISEQRLTIGRQAAELAQANATIAELKAEKPTRRKAQT